MGSHADFLRAPGRTAPDPEVAEHFSPQAHHDSRRANVELPLLRYPNSQVVKDMGTANGACRVGVVGCRGRGRWLARYWQDVEGAELAAVGDDTPEHADVARARRDRHLHYAHRHTRKRGPRRCILRFPISSKRSTHHRDPSNTPCWLEYG